MYTYNNIKDRIPEMSLMDAIKKWNYEYQNTMGARHDTVTMNRSDVSAFIKSAFDNHPKPGYVQRTLTLSMFKKTEDLEYKHYALRLIDSSEDHRWLFLWNIVDHACVPYLYGDVMVPRRIQLLDEPYCESEERLHFGY